MLVQDTFKLLDIVLGEGAILGGEKVDDDQTELVERGWGGSLARFVGRAVEYGEDVRFGLFPRGFLNLEEVVQTTFFDGL